MATSYREAEKHEIMDCDHRLLAKDCWLGTIRNQTFFFFFSKTKLLTTNTEVNSILHISILRHKG